MQINDLPQIKKNRGRPKKNIIEAEPIEIVELIIDPSVEVKKASRGRPKKCKDVPITDDEFNYKLYQLVELQEYCDDLHNIDISEYTAELKNEYFKTMRDFLRKISELQKELYDVKNNLASNSKYRL